MVRTGVRILLIVVIAAMVAGLSNCISAEETDVVKYDPARDEFRALMVLRDIQVSEVDDLRNLEAIYRNRDHLIMPASPGAANVAPLIALSVLRHSDTKFSVVNIFSGKADASHPAATTVPLDSIKIAPGTFFLEDKTLGYYQAITVPGKTLDVVLAELSREAQGPGGIKAILAELDRRVAGGKVFAWENLRTEVLKTFTLGTAASAPATAPDRPENPLMVLDAQSLENLKKAWTEKSLRLTRARQNVSLALPLTPADAAAVVELEKAIGRRVDELLSAKRDPAKDTTEVQQRLGQLAKLQAARRALTLSADAQGVTATVDLLVLVQALSAPPLQRADMNSKPKVAPLREPGDGPNAEEPATAPARPDVVAYLRSKNIPIDQTLTAAAILRDFNAGTLKAYPSDKPVKPGEGMTGASSRPAPESEPAPPPE